MVPPLPPIDSRLGCFQGWHDWSLRIFIPSQGTWAAMQRHDATMAIGGSFFLRSTGLGIGTVSQKISEFLQGSCEEATVTLTIKSDVQKKCLENMTSPHLHVKTALNCGPSGGLLILCCEYLMILCWDLNLGICCGGHAVSWISHLPHKHSKKGWNRTADVLQVMIFSVPWRGDFHFTKTHRLQHQVPLQAMVPVSNVDCWLRSTRREVVC